MFYAPSIGPNFVSYDCMITRWSVSLVWNQDFVSTRTVWWSLLPLRSNRSRWYLCAVLRVVPLEETTWLGLFSSHKNNIDSTCKHQETFRLMDKYLSFPNNLRTKKMESYPIWHLILKQQISPHIAQDANQVKKMKLMIRTIHRGLIKRPTSIYNIPQSSTKSLYNILIINISPAALC